MATRLAGLLVSSLLGISAAGALLWILQPARPVAAVEVAIPRTYPGPAPCDTSLQACIDGSISGDVINIQAGVYITGVTLNRAVSLIGAGSSTTILQALPNQRVMTATAAMTHSTQIAGLTIQGGNAGGANGGGLLLQAGAQPLIQNLSLIANSATNGGGLFATSAITLLNVTFSNNFATNGNGGGLYVGGAAVVTNSVFQNNVVITAGSGGGVFAIASFIGTNVIFSGNTVNNGTDGGGLYAIGPTRLTGGQFVNNQTTNPKGYGGGGGAMIFGQADISGTLFNGNVSSDWGGGAYMAFFANSTPSVLTNVQFISNTADSGGGGGLFMWFDSSLKDVEFVSNTASYRGGGLYAGYAGSYTTTIVGGQFVSNTASGGGGLYSDGAFTLTGTQFLSNTSRSGNGGGAWTPTNATVFNGYFANNTVITGGNSGGLDTGVSLTATDTIFMNNRTLAGSGGGSGAGANATLSNVQYISNSATVYGGGLLAYGAVSATNVSVLSNTTSNLGGGLATNMLNLSGSRVQNNRTLAASGGGIYAEDGARITDTQVLTNSAFTYGGGVQAGQTFLTGGVFQDNQSRLNGGGLSTYGTLEVSGTQFIGNSTNGLSEGGGALAASLAVSVTNGHFQSNTAAASHGGAIWTNAALWLRNTTLTGNTATSGNGGAAWARGPANIDQATFTQNQSGGNGGALFISNTVMVSNSQFINNFATSGGGLYQTSGGGQIVNSLFARNAASSGAGMALYLAPTGTLQIFFTTIAAPTLASGDAVRLAGGAVDIRNTIVSSHTIGLHRAGGAVTQDYNLLFGNPTPIFGVVSGGTNNASGDPRFVSPDTDGYHIGPGSAALDTGTDVGVVTDFDGQARPNGWGFDIGYDEAIVVRVFLPLILR